MNNELYLEHLRDEGTMDDYYREGGFHDDDYASCMDEENAERIAQEDKIKTDVAKIEKGETFFWVPGSKNVVCTQTDDYSGCGPVFSDPVTGHDVLRVSRSEFSQFDRYFRRV